MCGIAGFTSPGNPDQARATLTAMMAPMRHRGPDGEGQHVDRTVALGHLRLSIIDLTGGTQPRVEADGAALAFNGEIYGYRSLAEDLRRDGISLRDRSDTEVLFQLLRRDGVGATLERIDGMFAFAYREPGGRLWLVRDRFGEKPLFYGLRNGVAVFGSELGAVRRHPLFATQGYDYAALSRFLTLQYLPGEDSGVDGIRKLPPGGLLCFENGEARTERYWRPDFTPTAAAMPHLDRLNRLEELFSASVRDRLVADVPVGVFLSGGIDSALVAAFARRHAPDITAFSVKMAEESFDETPYARETAAHLGIAHQVIALERHDLLEAFDTVTAKLDEPLADSSLLPTFLVCRAARRQVTVALGGDGADELFAGYPNFKARRLAEAMALLPAGLGAALRAGIDHLPPSNQYMGLPFKLRQLSYGFGRDPDHQTHHWMAAISPAEQVGLWTPGALDASPDQLLRRMADEQLAGGDCRTGFDRLLYLFTTGYLAEDILSKVDRASMYNSLEVRAPFLAKDFAEFAMSLPPEDKLQGGTTKALLRRMALRHLPKSVVTRRKHGFAPPLAELLRGPLKSRVAPILLDGRSKLAGVFRQDEIRRLWTEHQSRRRDNHRKLWTLVVLLTWAR